jgi:hypothetical protein
VSGQTARRGLQRRRCGDCNDAAACDRAPAIKVPTKWSTPSAMPRAYSLSWRFATRYPFFNGMTPSFSFNAPEIRKTG